MTTTTDNHLFRLACLTSSDRHEHVYSPSSEAPQRCNCGGRVWKITCGGPIPALVTCNKCGTRNRIATAYERGREDASTTRASAADDRANSPDSPDFLQGGGTDHRPVPHSRPVAVVAVVIDGRMPLIIAIEVGSVNFHDGLVREGIPAEQAWDIATQLWAIPRMTALLRLLNAEPAAASAIAEEIDGWKQRGFPPPWPPGVITVWAVDQCPVST